jgi:cell fate regulator YaaT (PSP1 superfamily)
MTKFDPVSIRMAKKQGLSLNPTKISGVCGRLMCCLTFENEGYEKTEKPNKRKESKDK